MHTDPNWQQPPDKFPWFLPSKEPLLEHRKLLALDTPTQKKTKQRNKNGPKHIEKEGNFKIGANLTLNLKVLPQSYFYIFL